MSQDGLKFSMRRRLNYKSYYMMVMMGVCPNTLAMERVHVCGSRTILRTQFLASTLIRTLGI